MCFSQPPTILPDPSKYWRDAGGPRESPGLLSALGSSSPCPEQCQAGGATPSGCACLKDSSKLTHKAIFYGIKEHPFIYKPHKFKNKSST